MERSLLEKKTLREFVASLKACSKNKDVDEGIRLHSDIRSSGLLEKYLYLGNSLVSMYAKCGEPDKAQHVLDDMPARDIVSWNSLLAGYVQQGQGVDAFDCFDRLHGEGLSPDSFTYTCILKACSITGEVDKGQEIHDAIIIHGLLENNVVLGNALVNMYAKCGMLTAAQNVLDKLPVRDVVSWSALIAGYVQKGQGKQALDCFKIMQSEGLSPNGITYSFVLKACGITREVDMGEKIHDEIASQGLLNNDVVLGSALLDMYAKCGVLSKAQKALDELPLRDVVCWNTLMVGYAQEGHGKDVLRCYDLMRSEGVVPDAITYACALKACGFMQDADMGKRIHDEIVNQGLLVKTDMLGNALVDMYAKCGALMKAQQALSELPVRDVVAWSALIAGHVQRGQGHEALSCFRQMKSEGLFPTAITYACVLKACGITLEASMGQKLHDEIADQGLLEKDAVLRSALIDMYAKCGELTKAQGVLNEFPFRDIVSWNALVTGYAQRGQVVEALVCLQRMKTEGLSPNEITYTSILKACGIIREAEMGKKVHDEILSQGLLEKDAVLGCALVDMYAKCGAFNQAQKVLDELPYEDVVPWNVLIAEYLQQGQGEEALHGFQQMKNKGLCPDPITYAYILKACGIMGEVDMGKKLHEEIVSRGFLEKDARLGSAVIDMYAKCGISFKAKKVLNELSVKDAVAWNALIGVYALHGQGEQALDCFGWMRREGLSPDSFTYMCVLKACGDRRETEMGKQVHDEIASEGLLEKSGVLGVALVDMYAKCGELVKARTVLEELPHLSVVSWNALIAGYAQHGQVKEAQACFKQMRVGCLSPDIVTWNALIGGYAQEGFGVEALECFQRMQHADICPDAITFVSVLSACSHAGLLDEGQMFYEVMRAKYGITPDNEHHTCMVDLFGRARHFDKALGVINMMPSCDYPPLWAAFMGACQKWGNLELGRFAFAHAVQLDVHDARPYVLMGNIHAAAVLQEEAK